MPGLGEIARWVDGELIGPANKEIKGVAPIDEAGPDQITFAAEPRYFEMARRTGAGAVIVPKDAPEIDVPVIRVSNPRLAWVEVLERFQPPVDTEPSIHDTAVLGDGVSLGRNVTIGPHAVIGERAVIGDQARIGAGAYIGKETKIGRGTVIEPNVTVYDRVVIGKNVIIHAGCVIGGDGFGYVPVGKKQRKVPHLGTVIIEDDVELGALVAIDRGVSGATIIKRGTKVDNLVQIAHNVRIGEDCLIVSQVGIAGSAKLGDRVTLAGQSGVVGHVEVGDDTVVAGRGVVAKDIPARSFVSGFPARPHKESMRIMAATHRVPEMIDDVKALKRKLQQLEEKIRRLEEEIPAGGDA